MEPMPKVLSHQSIPCWTQLFWDQMRLAITIAIHRDIVPTLYEVSLGHLGFADFTEAHGFFSCAPEQNWGFGTGLKQVIDAERGFTYLSFEIPRVKKVTDTKCDKCNGTGEDQELGNTCLYCERGFKTVIDWKEAEAIHASLSVLSQIICSMPPEHDTSATVPQLLSFTTSSRPSIIALAGTYSGAVSHWLCHRRAKNLAEPRAAILIAWDRMMGVDGFDQMNTNVRIEGEGGWLNITGPGSGCGLFPTQSSFRKMYGYDFCDHNMDSSAHALALFAGLAALEQLIRNNPL